MICLICRRAEIVDRLAPVTFARGELKIVVNRVPARVCPSCGEAYVSEDVARRLLYEADETQKAGALNVVREY